MDFEAVCRTCLCTQFLHPIFKNGEHHDPFSVAMINTTGLKVEFNDGLPQKICLDCMSHINKSLKFRVQCKDAETKLLQLINSKTCKDTNTNGFSDDEKNVIEDQSNPSEKKPQEIYINIEDSDINFETECIIYDEKPLNDLFEKQNEINYVENIFNIDNNDEFIDNVEDVTGLEYSFDNIQSYINGLNSENFLSKESDYSSDIDTKKDNDTNEDVNKKVKKRVTCRICAKSLSIRSVDNHMNKRHPGADERKVKCELCDAYVLKGNLNQHSRIMHGKESKCGYCKSEFYTKESLVKHIVSCTDKKRKRTTSDAGKEMSECEICHKKMQKASLKMHKRIKHAGLGPICDHCGRKFGNKFRLNEHLRSKHGYEKYKCRLCDFQSASVLALRNHERRHSGEKPYICEVCGASFHAAYLLAQHRHSHRALRLLKCDLCPASFKANNSLHMHKMACHSQTTFKCTLCDRAYSCRQYAVKHLRSVHRYTGPVPSLERTPVI